MVARFVSSMRIWALSAGSKSVVKVEWRLWCRCRRIGRWHFRQLLCPVIAKYLGSGAGLILVVVDEWRPGCTCRRFGRWHSGTLDKRVRLCRVRTVKLLGGGTIRQKNSGRQAAWRPGCSWDGVVRDGWRHVWQLLCSVSARFLGSECGA